MDTSSFFHGPLGQNPVLDAVVKEVWHDLLPISPQLHSSGCLITDAEAYLNSLILFLPLIAKRLMNGPQMNKYIIGQMDWMQKNTDFSDFRPLQVLCDKTNSLRQKVMKITKAIESINEKPPNAPAQPPRNTALTSDHSGLPPPHLPVTSRATLPPPKPSSNRVEPTPVRLRSQFLRDNSARESSPAYEELLQKVSCRGNGKWTCPYSHCEFGGVRPDGSLTIFKRNSTFRGHLQRHKRPFKCDKPNCSNKRGFARIDQLRRHQRRCGSY